MKKKNKPVTPVYGFGLTFLLCTAVFGIDGLFGVIRNLILAFVVSKLLGSILKKDETPEKSRPVQPEKPKDPPKPPEEPPKEEEPAPASTGNPELDAVIREGRTSVRRIRELNDEIPDFKISAQLKQIEILTASIIDQVEQKPDKLKQVRQFMGYYLPTTIKLLEQYVQMQNVGLRGENIEAAMSQIEELLDKVIVAFQKQLDDLFERDVVDITAEIRVMEQMMASQGLTGQEDFKE